MSPTGSFRSLADWLAWLETLSPNEIELGLERINAVLERIDLHLPARVLHVAGTNGKGSSVAMLAALLRECGDIVGSYSSPHVFRFNERIRVDGEQVSDAEIVTAFEAVEAVRAGVPLTYFEYTTVAALLVFVQRGCSALVLEVGLGGRLDAVNAVEPAAGLITNVALDHCDWLGDDLESIAAEKAGIMRTGKPIVFGAVERPRSIDEAAAATDARLIALGRDYSWLRHPDSSWVWRSAEREIHGLRSPSLPGRFQTDNAAAVLALVEAIGLESLLDARVINVAFSELALPGRLQRLHAHRDWILDVAHNPHAAAALGRELTAEGIDGSIVAVVGVLDDKDVEGIVAPLSTAVDRWIAVTAQAGRAVAARRLAQRIARASHKPCLIAADIGAALRRAIETTTPKDTILVTGSFYVVGPALRWIERKMGSEYFSAENLPE